MDGKIKVLIVDDNETTRDGTFRLLEYEDEIEIVGFAENGAIAIEQVKEHSPDVVLMDINMPVMTGIEATQHLQDIAPRTQVIVVSVQDDAHYLKEAFRAGAVDFVAKPITSAELLQAIMRAYEKIPDEVAPLPVEPPPGDYGGGFGPSGIGGSRRQSRVITVLGFKGGVGKTTTAVNLAVGLAATGAETLIIDANLLFGDVSVFLNTRSQYTINDLAREAVAIDAIEEEYMNTILASHESGLKLLVAPANPNEVEEISQMAFDNMLTYLRRHFDYIIIDTGVALDTLLAASIQVADRLIVVTAPTMPTLKDTRILFSEVTALEYPKEDIILILNWADRDSRIKPDQITGFLKHEISLAIPPDMEMMDIVNQGKPVIAQDPKRVVSVRSLQGLVQLVKDSFERVPAEAGDDGDQRRGLFGLRG